MVFSVLGFWKKCAASRDFVCKNWIVIFLLKHGFKINYVKLLKYCPKKKKRFCSGQLDNVPSTKSHFTQIQTLSLYKWATGCLDKTFWHSKSHILMVNWTPTVLCCSEEVLFCLRVKITAIKDSKSCLGLCKREFLRNSAGAIHPSLHFSSNAPSSPLFAGCGGCQWRS